MSTTSMTTGTTTGSAASAHATAPADAGRSHHSRIGWRLGAASLVVGATGNTAQAVLSQLLGERPESITEQVALANEHPTLLTAMAVVGTVAVPFMAIGFLAAAQELGRRARKTSLAAGTLLVLGMWGFLAIQIAMVLSTIALRDPDGRSTAAFLEELGSHPLTGVLFGAPFMIGCVAGMLTLTIGLLVKGGVPRWIPAAWLVFIVLDFGIGRVGIVDPHWLYLAGAVGLATHLAGRGAPARAGG